MLVAALGYTTLAEGQGGWPSGYLKYGYQLGLTNGLSGIGNDDQLNRAQVSVLIDNALKCPICVSNGYTYNALGQQVPNTLIKDGTGDLDDTKDGYQNLLNYAHDAYLVYGRVSGTFKSGEVNDADQVRFTVEKSDNWEGYSLNAAKSDDEEEIKVYKGQVTDADNYLFSYAEAIIQKDRNDDYTFISLSPYGASEIIELEASDYKKLDTSKTSSSYGDQLQMYKDSGHSKYDTYKLDNNAKLYVNGTQLADYGESKDTFRAFIDPTTVSDPDDEAIGYISQNYVGKVTLVDATDTGKTSTDGYYDYIMVSYYVDGVVDEIDEETDEVTIILSDCDEKISDGEIVLKLDDDDFAYTITLNGEAIDVRDLQSDDVVSVAYEVTSSDTATSTSFSYSKTYDIIVSRDTVEGRVNTIYEDPDPMDWEYTIDGEIYKLAYSGSATLESGNSYTIYLDAFGKIAKVEELASSKKYALLENVYDTNGGTDYYADIVAGSGDKLSYKLKDSKEYENLMDILLLDDSELSARAEELEKSVDRLTKMESRVLPQDRVITYKLTSKNELKLDSLASADDAVSFTGEYKSNSSKIGNAKVTDALSQIVDISDYEIDLSQSYSSVAISDLVAGTEYTGYAYGKTGSDKVYQFVLILDGIGGFNVENPWAVFVQSAKVDTDNNTDADALTVYVDGELRSIPTDGTISIDNLTAGDVFFYKLNSDNEIDEIRMVTNYALSDGYHSFSQDAVNSGFNILNTATAAQFAGTASTGNFSKPDRADKNYLIAGPIVDVVKNSDPSIVTADQLNDDQTISYFAIDNCDDFDLAVDAKVYVYDYSKARARERLSSSNKTAIRKSTFNTSAYQILKGSGLTKADKDDNIVSFKAQLDYESSYSENYGTVRYAIAKVVDDEITEILVIVPDSTK